MSAKGKPNNIIVVNQRNNRLNNSNKLAASGNSSLTANLGLTPLAEIPSAASLRSGDVLTEEPDAAETQKQEVPKEESLMRSVRRRNRFPMRSPDEAAEDSNTSSTADVPAFSNRRHSLAETSIRSKLNDIANGSPSATTALGLLSRKNQIVAEERGPVRKNSLEGVPVKKKLPTVETSRREEVGAESPENSFADEPPSPISPLGHPVPLPLNQSLPASSSFARRKSLAVAGGNDTVSPLELAKRNVLNARRASVSMTPAENAPVDYERSVDYVKEAGISGIKGKKVGAGEEATSSSQPLPKPGTTTGRRKSILHHGFMSETLSKAPDDPSSLKSASISPEQSLTPITGTHVDPQKHPEIQKSHLAQHEEYQSTPAVTQAHTNSSHQTHHREPPKRQTSESLSLAQDEEQNQAKSSVNSSDAIRRTSKSNVVAGTSKAPRVRKLSLADPVAKEKERRSSSSSIHSESSDDEEESQSKLGLASKQVVGRHRSSSFDKKERPKLKLKNRKDSTAQADEDMKPANPLITGASIDLALSDEDEGEGNLTVLDARTRVMTINGVRSVIIRPPTEDRYIQKNNNYKLLVQALNNGLPPRIDKTGAFPRGASADIPALIASNKAFESILSENSQAKKDEYESVISQLEQASMTLGDWGRYLERDVNTKLYGSTTSHTHTKAKKRARGTTSNKAPLYFRDRSGLLTPSHRDRESRRTSTDIRNESLDTTRQGTLKRPGSSRVELNVSSEQLYDIRERDSVVMTSLLNIVSNSRASSVTQLNSAGSRKQSSAGIEISGKTTITNAHIGLNLIQSMIYDYKQSLSSTIMEIQKRNYTSRFAESELNRWRHISTQRRQASKNTVGAETSHSDLMSGHDLLNSPLFAAGPTGPGKRTHGGRFSLMQGGATRRESDIYARPSNMQSNFRRQTMGYLESGPAPPRTARSSFVVAPADGAKHRGSLSFATNLPDHTREGLEIPLSTLDVRASTILSRASATSVATAPNANEAPPVVPDELFDDGPEAIVYDEDFSSDDDYYTDDEEPLSGTTTPTYPPPRRRRGPTYDEPIFIERAPPIDVGHMYREFERAQDEVMTKSQILNGLQIEIEAMNKEIRLLTDYEQKRDISARELIDELHNMCVQLTAKQASTSADMELIQHLEHLLVTRTPVKPADSLLLSHTNHQSSSIHGSGILVQSFSGIPNLSASVSRSPSFGFGGSRSTSYGYGFGNNGSRSTSQQFHGGYATLSKQSSAQQSLISLAHATLPMSGGVKGHPANLGILEEDASAPEIRSLNDPSGHHVLDPVVE